MATLHHGTWRHTAALTVPTGAKASHAAKSDHNHCKASGAQRPAMGAARLLHTARQMVDTSRWWLIRWSRNATALLVRAGSLTDDEASKLFRALRVTAVRFGLELAALPKARHDAKEAADARTALRKRCVGGNGRQVGTGVQDEAGGGDGGLGCGRTPALVQGAADPPTLVRRGTQGHQKTVRRTDRHRHVAREKLSDFLPVGRIIMVSGDIFFIFMIMNKKKTANSAQISRKSEICAIFAFF